MKNWNKIKHGNWRFQGKQQGQTPVIDCLDILLLAFFYNIT